MRQARLRLSEAFFAAFALVMLLLLLLFGTGTVPAGTAAAAQGASPNPQIISVVYPTNAAAGETVSIAINTNNAGAPADNGIVSVSFPTNPDPRLICNPSCVTDAPGGWTKYPPGSSLACCGGTIRARYTDVEATTAGNWAPGTSYSFVVFLTLSDVPAGNLTFFVKTAMHSPPSGWVAYPPANCDSCPRDQQQEPVVAFNITVAQPATRSRTSSLSATQYTTATLSSISGAATSAASSPSAAASSSSSSGGDNTTAPPLFSNPIAAAGIVVGIGVAVVGSVALAFAYATSAKKR
jgi:hypothetical protein